VPDVVQAAPVDEPRTERKPPRPRRSREAPPAEQEDPDSDDWNGPVPSFLGQGFGS
jgi:hypothetical protein